MCEDFSFVDNPEFKSFISQYSTTDASTLRLKRFDNLKFDKNLAITQIECRRKAKKKLPELAEKIAYPTDVSIEQCSSEILAKFHANLFAGCDAVVDLTCGLGIDSFYIAQQTKSVVSIDAAEIVTSAVKHNMQTWDKQRFRSKRLCRKLFGQGQEPVFRSIHRSVAQADRRPQFPHIRNQRHRP